MGEGPGVTDFAVSISPAARLLPVRIGLGSGKMPVQLCGRTIALRDLRAPIQTTLMPRSEARGFLEQAPRAP